VTVIAAGFNVDQQDHIVNTESKKVFYTLEEEQTAQQERSPEATAVQESEVQGATEVRPERSTERVAHTLHREAAAGPELPRAKAGKDELIPTTQYLRNFNVFYEEVVPEYNDEEFIIVEAKEILDNIEVVEPKVVAPKAGEDQFSLSFDMPLAQQEEIEE